MLDTVIFPWSSLFFSFKNLWSNKSQTTTTWDNAFIINFCLQVLSTHLMPNFQFPLISTAVSLETKPQSFTCHCQILSGCTTYLFLDFAFVYQLMLMMTFYKIFQVCIKYFLYILSLESVTQFWVLKMSKVEETPKPSLDEMFLQRQIQHLLQENKVLQIRTQGVQVLGQQVLRISENIVYFNF